MTAEMALNHNHINEKKNTEKKFSWKRNMIEAGLLFSATQAVNCGNGRVAAMLMNDYRNME